MSKAVWIQGILVNLLYSASCESDFGLEFRTQWKSVVLWPFSHKVHLGCRISSSRLSGSHTSWPAEGVSRERHAHALVYSYILVRVRFLCIVCPSETSCFLSTRVSRNGSAITAVSIKNPNVRCWYVTGSYLILPWHEAKPWMYFWRVCITVWVSVELSSEPVVQNAPYRYWSRFAQAEIPWRHHLSDDRILQCRGIGWYWDLLEQICSFVIEIWLSGCRQSTERCHDM
jgi:hypothetical protein